jgi:hypothetical protein
MLYPTLNITTNQCWFIRLQQRGRESRRRKNIEAYHPRIREESMKEKDPLLTER